VSCPPARPLARSLVETAANSERAEGQRGGTGGGGGGSAEILRSLNNSNTEADKEAGSWCARAFSGSGYGICKRDAEKERKREREREKARELQGTRKVGVFVSTIVSLIAAIVLDFGIRIPFAILLLSSLSFSRGEHLRKRERFLGPSLCASTPWIGNRETETAATRQAGVPLFDLGEKSPLPPARYRFRLRSAPSDATREHLRERAGRSSRTRARVHHVGGENRDPVTADIKRIESNELEPCDEARAQRSTERTREREGER